MIYSFLQNGDTAITVQFKNEISKEVNLNVTSLTHIIENKKIRGVTELVPTFTSVTVFYNPCIISSGKLKRIIKKLIKCISAGADSKATVYEIPVCYDEEFSLDMGNVVSHTGLSREEIISIHTGNDYLIYMLGFLPGFAYLGGMDSRLFTPRLEAPRLEIPQGSVGIGGEQTGIYPVASPGGWQLIGRTPVLVYDKSKSSPILYKSGNYIRFVSIDKEEFYEIANQVKDGTYTVKSREVSL